LYTYQETEKKLYSLLYQGLENDYHNGGTPDIRHGQLQQQLDEGRASEADLLDAIREGAVLMARPKTLTAAVILAGL
jgi:hypothetical protein|tara:strand:+ start:1867 stop:2097 length:231 start_codon:yes stop_codon:yes gene_type:complete